ncbi:katanin p80 WD40 repeat-containing subunit B1 homolog isoform X2 [Cajanus cajan]|uniref:katanin p80 WD40 repeat-containing subunit B1 homolog isoform X2 n=1 Tax=Cajanus cajan TaxID=3821 RepID=UPI00098DD0D7|nr:katanin p80 WD40 repeat-containing subunit B1 homolog isoform X2 [Cajanus cajan]
MAKSGYKLQEFAAHSGNVNCLKIGRKARRLFVTGGDDHNVNLWMIGKPTSLMSLCGHTSSVESVAFDSAEVLVLSGASSGVIKLWDLEEAKMVRTLNGHRSNCTAVEFHPFGELFVSGSSDANLKIWDIRKKGCIHTYKGHSQGISTIKFSPDGRWVVSGGFDNSVKVWDLTGGKLLHDFKFHEGHIRSIDFHPLEFLLATGSAYRTVKFWDLETFELIGSTRYEVAGVRSIAFHPDGRTLFAGLEDSLKVYSWEPVICHDAVDMEWITLGDLCIHDGKLLGCSFYSNSVGVWVSDISLIEPYSGSLESERKESSEQKLSLQGRQMEKVEAGVGPTFGLCSMSPDNESKEIKNIYIDSSGGSPDTLPRSRSYNSPKVDLPEDSKEMLNWSPATGVRAKSNEQALKKSHIASNLPGGILNGKESATFSNSKPGMLLKQSHVQGVSTNTFDVDEFSSDLDSGTFCDTISKSDRANFQMKHGPQNEVRESIEDEHAIKSVTEKLEKTLTPDRFSEQEKCNQSFPYSKESSPVKYINGVAVLPGRTRSLVERFERREKTPTNEDQANATPITIFANRGNFVKEDQTKTSPITTMTSEKEERIPFSEDQNNMSTVPNTTSETDKSTNFLKVELQDFGGDSNSANEGEIIEGLMQTHDVTLSNLRSRLTKLQVVRHFWERNDSKGAVGALRKLPDQSVQADVVSVLVEKTEILTLDLFSCLLPVLVGLLDSKIERHVKVSLDMLLKLVAVFGPTIRSTISAPPSIGVDLHAEQRRECSNQCFMQLQKIRMILPIIIRRGGLLAKSAQELNLVLQQP